VRLNIKIIIVITTIIIIIIIRLILITCIKQIRNRAIRAKLIASWVAVNDVTIQICYSSQKAFITTRTLVITDKFRITAEPSR